MSQTVALQPSAKEFVLLIAGTRPSEEIRISLERYSEWKTQNRSKVLMGLSQFEQEHGITLNDITKIVTGGAPGFDDLGDEIAAFLGKDREIIYAEWSRHKKPGRKNPAGMLRNTRMQKISHGLLAFWDGQSSGTSDMIQKMRKARKPCTVVPVSEC